MGDRWARRWLPAAGIAIGVALIAGPLLAVAIRSLTVWTGAWPQPSPGNIADLFGDLRFADATLNTLIAGIGATILSLILGFTLAFLVCRTDMRGRRFWGVANLLPFFLSPYVGAESWVWLMAPHGGLLPTRLRESFGIALEWPNIYSLGGVIFILTLFYTPYVYWFLVPPLREIDAAYEETARAHGATFWYTLRHVTLPLVRPALVSAGSVVFIASAGLLDVPLALGAPRGIGFMPTEIYAMAQSPAGFGRAAAVGVALLTIVIVAMRWRHWMLSRVRFDIIPGTIYRRRLMPLRWPAHVAALSLEAFYLGYAVLLPLVALLMVSLTKLWMGRFSWRAANFTNFDYVLSRYDVTRSAITNTLFLALCGATIGVALAIPQSYYLARGDSRRRGVVEIFLAAVPGIPGLALSLGLLILMSRTLMSGTLSLILIACLARFPALATSNVTATFRTIDPALEQIARSSGASWAQTMWLTIAPRLKWSLVASWLILFAICIRELGGVILLCTRDTETISAAMVALGERDQGYVAALGVVQLVLLLLVFVVFSVARLSPYQRPA